MNNCKSIFRYHFEKRVHRPQKIQFRKQQFFCIVVTHQRNGRTKPSIQNIFYSKVIFPEHTSLQTRRRKVMKCMQKARFRDEATTFEVSTYQTEQTLMHCYRRFQTNLSQVDSFQQIGYFLCFPFCYIQSRRMHMVWKLGVQILLEGFLEGQRMECLLTSKQSLVFLWLKSRLTFRYIYVDIWRRIRHWILFSWLMNMQQYSFTMIFILKGFFIWKVNLCFL